MTAVIHIVLDQGSVVRWRGEVEHERKAAITDLLRENSFSLAGAGAFEGPYYMYLHIAENRLIMDIANPSGSKTSRIAVTLVPFRSIIRDYFIICESYFDAVKTAMPTQIEALDMGRRAAHNEGAGILKESLSSRAIIDLPTARRLFTLMCVLHLK